MSSQEQKYLILDTGNNPLAKGIMESPPGTELIQLRVLGGGAEAVTSHEIVELISMGPGGPSLQCRLVRGREDRIVLERISVLDPEVRRNLRIPVRFDTLLYPVTGGWKGRRRVESVDLSCGGIAFVGADGMDEHEIMEVIIPITSSPLILRSQILRKKELNNDRALYACKFVDMCDGEETLVREAVFSVQLQNRPRSAANHTQEVLS